MSIHQSCKRIYHINKLKTVAIWHAKSDIDGLGSSSVCVQFHMLLVGTHKHLHIRPLYMNVMVEFFAFHTMFDDSCRYSCPSDWFVENVFNCFGRAQLESVQWTGVSSRKMFRCHTRTRFAHRTTHFAGQPIFYIIYMFSLQLHKLPVRLLLLFHLDAYFSHSGRAHSALPFSSCCPKYAYFIINYSSEAEIQLSAHRLYDENGVWWRSVWRAAPHAKWPRFIGPTFNSMEMWFVAGNSPTEKNIYIKIHVMHC